MAQLEDGTFAPDFTLQDLNGNTWHLYDLLAEGKHVILDFSATWCTPCWSYHESGVLNEAYTMYGPEGTDELMIFMIEGDDETNLACLYDLPECSLTSQGDWVTGTLYPIINDDFIKDVYEIQGWPSHFHICPNKIISRTSQPGLESIDYFLLSCAEPVGENNASITEFKSYTGAFCQSISTSPVVEVQNLGHQNMAQTTASCYINGILRATTVWEGFAEPFATFTMEFPEMVITETANVLVTINTVNGVPDDDISDNDLSTFFISSSAKTQNILQLELKTNYLPEGVYWELMNSDSVVLYSGGNPAVIGKEANGISYAANAVYIIPIPLPGDGCYKFAVYDANGINAGVDYYKITGPSNELMAQGGFVEYYEQDLFHINQASLPIYHNGAIQKVYGLPQVFCSHQTFAFSVDLLNLSAIDISTAEIELLEDGQLVSKIEYTGQIPPGTQASIDFPDVSLTTGQHIVFRIKSINGSPDVYEYLNEYATDLKRYVSEDEIIQMELQLNPSAYQTYWQLTNNTGEVLYSGGNTNVGPHGGGLLIATSGDPGAYAPLTKVDITFQLPDTGDCYSFLLVDSFGDGLSQGSYVKFYEKSSGKEIFKKDYLWTRFVTDEILLEVNPTAVSVNPIEVHNALQVYPNPFEDRIELVVSPELQVTGVEIYNAVGARIYSDSFQNSIHLPSLQSGMYFIKIITADGRFYSRTIIRQ